MKVVVLGCKGMLGTDVLSACRAAAGIEATGHDVDTLDITDSQQLKRLPFADWVINCAAYTRVDDAEKQRDQAYAINAEGARNLAHICARRRAGVLYVSTDYVFDGTRRSPYTEHDQTNPVNIYGASKLAGEKAVRGESVRYLVVRTQSLFGKHGPNFVRSIAKKLKAGDGPARVVADQTTAPTYTRHVADAIVRLVQLNATGIVHVAASHSCSWHAFAEAIAQRVAPDAGVEPIESSELERPAPRPPYAVLDTRKYRMLTGRVMPTWEQGLDEYLAEEEL